MIEPIELCRELQEALDAQSEVNLHTGAMLVYVDPSFFARLRAVVELGSESEQVGQWESGKVRARAPRPEMEFPDGDYFGEQFAPAGAGVSSAGIPVPHLLGVSPAGGSDGKLEGRGERGEGGRA